MSEQSSPLLAGAWINMFGEKSMMVALGKKMGKQIAGFIGAVQGSQSIDVPARTDNKGVFRNPEIIGFHITEI